MTSANDGSLERGRMPGHRLSADAVARDLSASAIRRFKVAHDAITA